MGRTVVDLVDIRPCHHCGSDVLNVNPGMFLGGPDLLDPRPVLDGSTVAWGWRFDDCRWVVHIGHVSPGHTAFRVHECADSQRKGTVSMTDTTIDPFAGGDKRPAVSFKDAPAGTVITCVVTGAPKLVQSRDYKTKEPDFWPDGNPKMAAVIDVTVNGEERSVWASKPSALFAAIADAQRVSGQQIAPGGTLHICFTGTKPTEGDPQKLYSCKYEPPNAFAQNTAAAPPEPAAAATAPWG